MKDEGQKRILAIDISREGFEWALDHSCPSHRDPTLSDEEWRQLKEKSPVRIQWDPERDIFLNPRPYRAIQIGLSGEAVERYVKEWIQKITEATSLANEIFLLLQEGRTDIAGRKLPEEMPYPSKYQL